MAFLGAVPHRGSREWKIIDRMCETWAQFAKTGDPNNEAIAPVKWEALNENHENKNTPHSSHKCLNIDDEIEFIGVPAHERLLFWDEFYKKCNRDLV